MTFTTTNNEGAKSPYKHLIVGSGVSGIEFAVALEESGYTKDSYVIFEASTVNAGCWNPKNTTCGSANYTSTIQSDPVIYAPAGWFLDEAHRVEVMDAFQGIKTTQARVVENTNKLVEKYGIQENIKYHRKVLSFQTNDNDSDKEGTVNVTWADVQSGEIHTETFASVHFRTGHLSKPRKVLLPKEEHFAGPIVLGNYNKPSELDLTGKTVAIVGWGTFAVENTIYCLRNGASKVHILSRQDKPHWFDYATYLSSRFYDASGGADPLHGTRLWQSIHDANNKAAESCGAKDVLYTAKTVQVIEGKEHYYFQQGGNPCFSIDPVALGMHYGLVEYHRGNVADMKDTSIVMDSGETVEADIIVKCLGYETAAGFLEGRYCTDAFFVDGKANITSFHGIDGIEEPSYFGPDAPGTSSWLLSIYCSRDIDKAIIYFMKNPDKFAAFKSSPLFATCKEAFSIGIVALNVVFSKLFAFGDMNIIQNFVDSMTLKQKEYAKVLDEQTFLKHDKNRWDTWSEFLAKKAEKPVLVYPFAETLAPVTSQ